MTELVSRSPRIDEHTLGYTYQGEAIRHVAMPHGGLGAGQIALGGDGALRQWQIVNQINHLGFVPDSFFAIRTSCTEPPLNVIRLLQSREAQQLPVEETPLVNDNAIAEDQRALHRVFTGVERTTFTGAYPFSHIAYQDAELPLDVTLDAHTPFVPLDAENSALPAIIFTFTVHNPWQHKVHGCLAATQQNLVGWDGVTSISGNRCPLYGGNTNRIFKRAGYTSLVMENASLPDDHPGAGQVVLTSLTPTTRTQERWTTFEQFLHILNSLSLDRQGIEGACVLARPNKNIIATGPSAQGETWNGGLIVPFRLAPGATTTITFILSWYFPNRYVNFDQFGPPRPYGKSRFWLGNAYAARFHDAQEVTEYVIQHHKNLEETARQWVRGIYQSTLPDWFAEMLATQATFMRSPTCFWSADGKFFGFEGSLGLSTAMWNGTVGGSCPLNCTHVWNYEMALSRLFPRLEQSMRETDFEHVQAPEGYIPHRTIVPLYLPQFWNVPIGGPTNPALDGMLGTILKTYREVRQGAGRDWLDRLWPRVKRLMNYIIEQWDDNNDGVLEGEQPNTYDIEFYGPNMYIGALWLAALRAAEEMAKLQGEQDFAQSLHERFELGSTNYDEQLWNGEYYIQIIDHSMPLENQFGEGCLADQLFGQWWAHLLDLGYILPEAHVKTTLRSIVRNNLRHGFRNFEHGYRVFADQDDSGLIVCTWPRGGRPEIPVRYCDEVWTGMEYQVGAHCLMEGLVEEGMSIIEALRKRYDGTRRNPYNEIECGDHYARAMAGWSVLEALSGFRYNALEDHLSFAPVANQSEFQVPFITGSGWGTFAQSQDDSHITLTCSYGDVRIQQLSLQGISDDATVTLDGNALAANASKQQDTLTLAFTEPVILRAGSTLTIVSTK
ncbi:hypothetical protein KSF_069340 [Reticulibacter mediterranei]|uniref:Glucosylceramidase n=1 Tax=Reticulibacter mediterranei TaxID=2778369 RepID=A0A8J3IVD0_9CHLR|nr:GH116 family glycosyl-hydrolase [Reticulibacter mediterranei]GHO96886.1 hypothetical protein KSF_069340 [Reticulibacter mediterranei]